MRDNLLMLACLCGGVALGAADAVPAVLLRPELSVAALGLLVFQVGLGLGSRGDLRGLLRAFRWPMLLLPAFTVAGTLLAAGAVWLLLGAGPLRDGLAVASGMGYYSLSSVIIVHENAAACGAAAAARLGAVALLANVVRELVALFGCAFFTRRGGSGAAIAVAGVTSMDVCLPAIMRAAPGPAFLPVALVHGILLEAAVPVLVTAFCH